MAESAEPVAFSKARNIVTIGNFDGVHRGHQAVLAAAAKEALRLRIPLLALTFEPHPREFFTPQEAPARISTLRDKLLALSECGVEHIVVLRFNAHLAALSPEAFVQKILLGCLNVAQIWVGDDFRFGAQRAGDFALLQSIGRRTGFSAHTVPACIAQNERISSSSVRLALEQGNMQHAADLLGRAVYVTGRVQHGRKLGRTLGFPTLNIRLTSRAKHHASWRPALQGIFIVRLHGLDETANSDARPVYGVASLGQRPTIEESGRYLLEVHVLDWHRDSYGRLVRVEFLHKLRAEAKYDDLPTLQEAIQKDVNDARTWLMNKNSGC